MQINAKTKDVVWNYLGIFFSLGSQIIWLPVLLHYLPPDILGLWYVFVSIGGLVELMDSGFTPTLSLGVAYFASGFVMRSLCKYYLLRMHHFDELMQKYRHQIMYSKKHILAMMWPNAWRDGLVTVTFYLTGQATVLLSSNVLTLYETGIYSFSMQVINAIIGISYGMFEAYITAIQSAYVSRNRDMMRMLYAKSMACGLYLSIAGITVFATIGITIVKWLRHDFTIDRPVFLMMACSIYLMARHRNSACFIAMMNRLPYTFSFIFFGILTSSAPISALCTSASASGALSCFHSWSNPSTTTGSGTRSSTTI